MEICERIERCDAKNYFKSKDFAYLQPKTRQSYAYRKSYRRPMIKLDTETIYKASYRKPDVNFKFIREKSLDKQYSKLPGEIDFSTVHKASFKSQNGKSAEIVQPRTHLGCPGCPMNMKTVYRDSYMNPGLINTATCRPNRDKFIVPMKMESCTTMKKSYEHPGKVCFIKYSKPQESKYCPWITNYETDFRTVVQESYKPVTVVRRKPRGTRPYRTLNIKIDCDTTYGMSYLAPGCFIKKKN
ncbi:uncharacterized protein LOC112494049 [Cephus cinctus]|uniref:Uncharacterized protein LOC112494049 n=1 Tax=Cephus cinctus TaxID=211228 RepID=A0AAJ7VZC9_CEPCN|nr:uncharacterized protein LOC112494049 [Cephus cinctus]